MGLDHRRMMQLTDHRLSKKDEMQHSRVSVFLEAAAATDRGDELHVPFAWFVHPMRLGCLAAATAAYSDGIWRWASASMSTVSSPRC